MFEDRHHLTAACFAALTLNGLTLAFMGTCLASVQAYLGISMDKAGLLMGFLQAGFTLFSLLGGILSDRIKCEKILSFGCFLLCLSLIFFCKNPRFWFNVVLVCFAGAGMGCILSGTNTLLANLYPSTKSAILNIHHVFFGIGILLGPLLLGSLISREIDFRTGFMVESAVLFFLGMAFFILRGSYSQISGWQGFDVQFKKLAMDKYFLTIVATNIFSIGVQVSILLMGVSFLMQAKGCSLTMASSALSFFAVFLILGRLICSRLTLAVHPAMLILFLLWLQVILLFLAWQGNNWVSVGSLAASGFAFSGIYPTCLSLSGNLFPDIEGSVLGILSTMGGLGSILLCWLTGYLANLFDMQTAFIVMVISGLTALIVFQIHYAGLCRRLESDRV